MTTKKNTTRMKSLYNTSNLSVTKLHNLKNTLLHLVNVVDSIIEENQPEPDVIDEPSHENTLVQSIHSLEHSVDHLCDAVQQFVDSNTSNNIISKLNAPHKSNSRFTA